MGSKKAPPPDPAQQELARQQAASMRYADEFSRKAYDESHALALAQESRASEEFDWQKGLARTSQDWAEQDRKFYYDTTGYQLNKLNETAKNFDAGAMGDKYAGQATADIESAYEGSTQGMQRAMAARGMNLGSPAAMAMYMDTNLDKSLAKAGASTMARNAARMEGLNLSSTVAGMGAGFGSGASSGLASASGMGMSSLSAGGVGLGSMSAASNIFNQGQGTAIGWGSGANSTYNSLAQQNYQRSQSGGGFGSFVGNVLGKGLGAFANTYGAKLGG